ncbi:hypothetical protein D9M68_255720 [compost metagenome]
MHHSYSSSVSPFQANTGMPAAAMAAAAWSWVEKMLQDDQRTSAPRATRVSMRTAVWMVMWMQPRILAPFSGWVAEYLRRRPISAGISDSAMMISRRPQAAREMSATL